MRWGILSTGHIAHAFAKAVLESHAGRLAAVGSRTLQAAQGFAREYEIPNACGNYSDLLADPAVEAVYIATPHPHHAEWAMKAAQAGKHILCEKPLAMNLTEAETIVRSARENHVVLMEAFMYRCHPQTHRLLELLREGVIGTVRVIRSSFSFDRDLGLQHRLFNRALGGGGILDIGCYPVSISRLSAGVAMGKPFAEPTEVKGLVHIGPESGVDEWASAVLRFPGDIMAELSCGIRVEREHGTLVVYGSEGRLEVPAPWHCGGKAGETHILLYPKGSPSDAKPVTVKSEYGVYSYEVDAFAEAVARGRVESPAMTPEDSLGNMAVLDKWLSES